MSAEPCSGYCGRHLGRFRWFTAAARSIEDRDEVTLSLCPLALYATRRLEFLDKDLRIILCIHWPWRTSCKPCCFPKGAQARKYTMTADEINRSFPNIVDWIQGSGWIEIGNQEWQGFIVRALGEGGEVIEVEQIESLGEALVALEAEIPNAGSRDS